MAAKKKGKIGRPRSMPTLISASELVIVGKKGSIDLRITMSAESLAVMQRKMGLIDGFLATLDATDKRTLTVGGFVNADSTVTA